MAKIVNCWNEWDPLKRVVVGRPEGTTMPAPGPDWQHNAASGGIPLGYWGYFPQDMVDAAIEQQDGFIKIMEKRGIIVDRVSIHHSLLDGRPVGTPDWMTQTQHGQNNPRDLFLPLGNEIMEAPGSRRSRWYEYLCMRPLFEKWFKEDPDFLWTAAPKPRLTDESFVKNYWYDFISVWSEEEKRQKMLNWEYHLTEKEPMWDAADACRAGKDIFWQASAVTNRGGMEWLRRYLASRGLRLRPIQFDSTPAGYWRPWHIDVILTFVRPGLAIVSADKNIVTPGIFELFKRNDWELVTAARPVYEWHDDLTMSAPATGKGLRGTNWISMNTFSLDPKTMCVSDKEPGYMEQLNKLGVEVLPVAYEKVYRFGGMLHCNTLDVYREGKCEDYFPNN